MNLESIYSLSVDLIMSDTGSMPSFLGVNTLRIVCFHLHGSSVNLHGSTGNTFIKPDYYGNIFLVIHQDMPDQTVKSGKWLLTVVTQGTSFQGHGWHCATLECLGNHSFMGKLDNCIFELVSIFQSWGQVC